MQTFKLTLKDSAGLTRNLMYNPSDSRATWEDSEKPLDLSRLRLPPDSVLSKSFTPAHQLSPNAPGTKSRALSLIKIQLGFRCNFSCHYCSQSTQRQDVHEHPDLQKAHSFIDALHTWYEGGQDGLGQGTRFEFWGGETLLYWRYIKIIAPFLIKNYPHAKMALFTNGSIMNDEIMALCDQWNLHIIVSHDGKDSSQFRGKDPFQDPAKKQTLMKMYHQLAKKKLISFNCTITSKNFSLKRIQDYLALQLGVAAHMVPLSFDLSIPYQEDNFRFMWSEPDAAQAARNQIFSELTLQGPLSMNIAGILQKVFKFYETLNTNRPASSLFQKCGMDRPDSIAVDLDGNVLSCQNTTADKGHKIGRIDDFQNVCLNTSYHWSQRAECRNCPVLQLCQGSCMLLKGDIWDAACDQYFNWNLTVLAVALYFLTDQTLIRIEGRPIRRAGTKASMDVITL